MIGVFDSGVGGVSVLRELRQLLPHEDFVYYADSGHCPYGGKTAAQILARSSAISEELIGLGAKLIVVACNTATIAAVESLRATYPVPFVGMEPALKPAVAATRSGVVGVLATGAALAGEKFLHLLARHARDVRVINQPCPGLVECVERGEIDNESTQRCVDAYVQPLIAAGADVLVLGCTHYPFLRAAVARAAGAGVTLLDSGEAVAQQARRVLEREGLLAGTMVPGQLRWRTSGEPATVLPIARRLLG